LAWAEPAAIEPIPSSVSARPTWVRLVALPRRSARGEDARAVPVQGSRQPVPARHVADDSQIADPVLGVTEGRPDSYPGRVVDPADEGSARPRPSSQSCRRELRRTGATDRVAANAVLRRFVPASTPLCCPAGEHGRGLATEPEELDLANVCAFRWRRAVGSDNTVRLEGALLQLPPGPGGRSLAGRRVEVELRLDGRLLVLADGRPRATVPAAPEPRRLREVKSPSLGQWPPLRDASDTAIVRGLTIDGTGRDRRRHTRLDCQNQ
jgi:hypothetical protein